MNQIENMGMPWPGGPAQAYLHRASGEKWLVELEIGGAVWLSNAAGTTEQRSLAELSTDQWERIQ
ncbi:hypothetical protein D3C76_507900 [compost metagenome]